MNDFEIRNGVLIKYNGTGGDVVIPNGVTSIGKNAFCDAGKTIAITVVSAETDILDALLRPPIMLGSCEGCKTLTSVTIPEGVTSIDEGAFNDCSALKSVKLPNSLKSIGKSAFAGCSRLESITIPYSVEAIYDFAFGECGSLKKVIIADNVKSVSKLAFSGCKGINYVVCGTVVFYMLSPELKYTAVRTYVKNKYKFSPKASAAIEEYLRRNKNVMKYFLDKGDKETARAIERSDTKKEQAYEQAKKKLNKSGSAKELLEVRNALEELDDYRDSEKLMFECDEKYEEARINEAKEKNGSAVEGCIKNIDAYKAAVDKALAEKENTMGDIVAQEKEELNAEKKKHEDALKKIGLFSFSERNVEKAEIKRIAGEIKFISSADYPEKKMDEYRKKGEESVSRYKAAVEEYVRKKYNVRIDPDESEEAEEMSVIKDTIFRMLTDPYSCTSLPKKQASEIRRRLNQNFSAKKTHEALRQLTEEGKIKKSIENDRCYYGSTEREPTKMQRENAEITKSLLYMLEKTGRMTAPEMATACGCSTQRASGLMHQCFEQGIVVREIVNSKAYYSINKEKEKENELAEERSAQVIASYCKIPYVINRNFKELCPEMPDAMKELEIQ